MWNFDISEALSLTVIGLGAVFFVLFLILTMTLLLKRVLPSPKSTELPPESPRESARPERNDKELAAVAAVAATLALDERDGPPTQDGAAPGSAWRRYGRERAMSSRGRRGWRK
jgi:Na+-transporting methylmalonyl-CoA/oxaloacetate decarboxylase gamma subunit